MTEKTHPVGFQVLSSASLNKGTAFTADERRQYKLRGLLPPRISSLNIQMQRTLENLRRQQDDIERYVMLTALQSRNERLFYNLTINHIEEIMPLIYTPTVGQACKEYAHLYRRPRGMYITADDKGEIREVLENWPYHDISVIVVTDGERILGLGDLGANGIGIPIGKLSLYVACAGIHPHQCLPIMLDVGTNNQELLDDPLYLGINRKRLTGRAYLDFIDEFINAARDIFPAALIQFEDFLTPNAYTLLNKYKDQVRCFNDDIQGTAGVALAGIYASTRISGLKFSNLQIMFLGAGSAATGIADLICYALQQAGLNEAEARRRLWFVDINGLVVAGRPDLMPHNLPYAHEHRQLDFISAIESVRPQVLIGATGSPNTFNRQVIESMCAINDRPVVFALSNPTSRAECIARHAYEWSKGKVIFASGSPFAEVRYEQHSFRSGQGNNVYIFPGIGLGVTISKSRLVTDDMFLLAARCLAKQVTEQDLARGTIYPPLNRIREVSLKIAADVARHAFDHGLAETARPDDLEQAIAEYMYQPGY